MNKALHSKHPGLARKSHLEFKHGQLWTVTCHCCGNPIRNMVPDRTEVVHIANKPVVNQYLVMACLASYREVLLEMSDGSKHVAAICADCVADLQDPEVLQAVYDMDVAQWKREGWTPPKRKPVRVLRAANVIEGD